MESLAGITKVIYLITDRLFFNDYFLNYRILIVIS